MISRANEITLSERLLTVASMVNDAARSLGMPAARVRLADIGTDHAYLPIFLIREGMVGHVVATDVNDGPLARAVENVKAAGYADQIELRHSDGFAALRPRETDIAVISGMGGRLIQKMIESCSPATLGIRRLILQPQSEVRVLWDFMKDSGWDVVDERMVYEEEKFYTMMHLQQRGETSVYVAEDFGAFLSAGRDEAWHLFLQKEQASKESLLQELKEKNVSKERIARLEAEQANIEAALAVFGEDEENARDDSSTADPGDVSGA